MNEECAFRGREVSRRVQKQISRYNGGDTEIHRKTQENYVNYKMHYFRPSTMMMWYPNCVLTSDDKIGLSTVDGWSAKAASWNAP